MVLFRKIHGKTRPINNQKKLSSDIIIKDGEGNKLLEMNIKMKGDAELIKQMKSQMDKKSKVV